MHEDSIEQASDAALADAIGRWRQDALADAYRRHAGAVFGSARRMLADHSMAEEVVQEVFLRLWGAPELFDPRRGSLRSYLLAPGHGRALERGRAASSRRWRERSETDRRSGWALGVDGEVGAQETAGEVPAALASRPPDERVVIELRRMRPTPPPAGMGEGTWAGR